MTSPASQPQNSIREAKIPWPRAKDRFIFLCSKQWFFILLLMVCLTQSGCELLSLPGQIIGGLFGLAGQALSVAQTMPMPPPWLFF